MSAWKPRISNARKTQQVLRKGNDHTHAHEFLEFFVEVLRRLWRILLPVAATAPFCTTTPSAAAARRATASTKSISSSASRSFRLEAAARWLVLEQLPVEVHKRSEVCLPQSTNIEKMHTIHLEVYLAAREGSWVSGS